MLVELVAAGWLAMAAPPDVGCLACHGDPSVVGSAGRGLVIDARTHAASAHGALECTTCHDTIKEYPHPKHRPKVSCTTCHGDEGTAVGGERPHHRAVR